DVYSDVAVVHRGVVDSVVLPYTTLFRSHSINIAFEQDPLAIHQLLSEWFPNSQASVNPVRKEAVACPSCGFSFPKFLQLGKFGCASCYDSFSSQLDEIFKRFHNVNTEHTGKISASYVTIMKIK